jgi:hypothetical protein
MYQHLKGMRPELTNGWTDPGFDAWFDGWIGTTPYFPIVSSFWRHRDDPDLLWLRYEDLKVDLAGAARRCVAFLGWEVDDRNGVVCESRRAVDRGVARVRGRSAAMVWVGDPNAADRSPGGAISAASSGESDLSRYPRGGQPCRRAAARGW